MLEGECGHITRIVVFGTESTGKTTLSRQLAAHFHTAWSEEYVREFWGLRHGNIAPTDLDMIARGQVVSEENAAEKARKLLICDTDLLTNVLWDDLLFPGHCPNWVRRLSVLRSRRQALYLLCDTDVDFVSDMQRSFPAPEDRARCRALWRNTLITHRLPYVDIRGSWQERLDTAIHAIMEKTGLLQQESALSNNK